VDYFGLLPFEPQVDRRDLRDRPRDADRMSRAHLLGHLCRERRAHLLGCAPRIPREALGQAHAPQVVALVEGNAFFASDDELRRAAADVDDQRLVLEVAAGRHPAERQ
jgi:hypothetical protein